VSRTPHNLTDAIDLAVLAIMRRPKGVRPPNTIPNISRSLILPVSRVRLAVHRLAQRGYVRHVWGGVFKSNRRRRQTLSEKRYWENLVGRVRQMTQPSRQPTELRVSARLDIPHAVPSPGRPGTVELSVDRVSPAWASGRYAWWGAVYRTAAGDTVWYLTRNLGASRDYETARVTLLAHAIAHRWPTYTGPLRADLCDEPAPSVCPKEWAGVAQQ